MKNRMLIAFVALVATLLATVAPDAAGQTVIDISSPAPGSGYTIAGEVLTINADGDYIITGATTENRVVVASDVTATVTLRNVSITSATASPFELNSKGCNVVLKLEENNSLAATMMNNNALGIYGAAIQVEGTSSVTIEGNGSLTATGGEGAAGIGSGYVEGGAAHVTGDINIKGGNLTITGSALGAGIGGGYMASGGNINISGGNLTVKGGNMAAGIGCGSFYSGNSPANINISGGFVSVSVNHFDCPVAIGGSSNDIITISGGMVFAYHPGGNGDNPAIGGGTPGNINISGGSVFAYSGSGVGIGGGAATTGGSINISGGTVVANKIGTGSGSSTPTSVSGSNTVILTGSINTTDFGAAQVVTGVSLSLEMMQTMAANMRVEHLVAVHDTIAITDTLYVKTPTYIIIGHDTLHDTTYLIPPDTRVIVLHDTLHPTIYIDRWQDTVERYYPVVVHDTIHLTHWRTELVHDTLRLTDTFLLSGEVYVIIDQPRGNGGNYIALPDPRATSGDDGSVLITDLTPNAIAVIFDLTGHKVQSAVLTSTVWHIPYLPPGLYLLWHSDLWSRFTHK